MPVQVTVEAATVQVPLFGVVTQVPGSPVRFAGSVNVSTAVAGATFGFVSVAKPLTVLPGEVQASGSVNWKLRIWLRSLSTGVGGVVMGPLPLEQPTHSLGLLMLTVLPLIGFSAVAAMETSSTSVLLPATAIGFEFVQVTFGTEPVQVQPGVEVKFTA